MATVNVTSEIKHQVRLPLAVAFEVAVQGIRIRLGRSLITLVGISLGMAFLMSILMAQACRKGVARETAMRADVQRMISFLTAETGPVSGRKLTVLQTGDIDERESRFVNKLIYERPSNIAWVPIMRKEETYIPFRGTVVTLDRNLSNAIANTSGVIVLGNDILSEMDWPTLLAGARKPVVAFSRSSQSATTSSPEDAITLEYVPRKEEIEETETEARRSTFRTIWIVFISLLVTVIGVSNAMLMSVTERFREIGTMKCLGALSRFIRQLFLMESLLMGIVGSTAGSLFGAVFSFIFYGFTYGFALVVVSINWGWVVGAMLASIITGIFLAVLAAIYPATFAARMVPATALRSNV